MFKKHFFLSLDLYTIIAVVFLMIASLLAMYAIFPETVLENQFFLRQLVYSLLAIGIIFFFAHWNYQQYARYGLAVYAFVIALLAITLFIGVNIRGTVGWIDFGFFALQPVEVVKILMIVVGAFFLTRFSHSRSEAFLLSISFLLIALPVVLVLQQPDFGSAVALSVIWIMMLFSTHLKKTTILTLSIFGVSLLIAGWFMLAAYQKERIFTFLDPTRDPRGSGYNVIQASIAIGSGGIAGRGIRGAEQTRLNFLPEKHTDFVYASFVESTGLLGATFLISVYLMLFWRMWRIALRARDTLGYYLCVGIFGLFFIHVVINIGMNIGIMPVTGIPLPFMSFGGSAFISMAVAIGILLNVGKQAENERKMTHLEYQ